MQLGSKGSALIQSFEKLALESYPDQGGIYTIGWGHTGPEVCAGMTCTREQADAWFIQDTQAAVAGVKRSLTVPVSQNQFDALVAFTFNVGVGAEAHSTLVRLVNSGNVGAAALEFARWNKVGGYPSPGLTRRRAAELGLFLTP